MRTCRWGALMADDAIFWERLDGMPDVEADQELRLRRDQLVLENGMLKNEIDHGNLKQRERHRIGVVICENNMLINRINQELRDISNRNTKTTWRRAVVAVLGEEAAEACRIWIAQTEEKLGGRHKDGH